MDSAHPLVLSPFNNSNFIKAKERQTFNQVMTCKASSMQRVVQVVQRVAQKSCRRACQLFCCALDTVLCDEKVTCCPAQNHQPTEDKTTVAIRSLPSTILIVNISNSTLIDCVIGNDTYHPSAVTESQPLMQGSELQMHDQARCSCSRGQEGAAHTSAPPPPPSPLPSAEPPSINIHSSHLNCVIIGDNNYMHAEQTLSSETEEPQV